MSQYYTPGPRVRSKSAIAELLWPWGKLSFLGFIAGLLSLISVWFFAVGPESATLLSEISRKYDEVLGISLGWVEPLGQRALAAIGVNVRFDPQWKHVFVLVSLYFSAGVWAEYKANHRRLAFARAIVGLLLAAFAGLYAGSLERTGAWLPNFLIHSITRGCHRVERSAPCSFPARLRAEKNTPECAMDPWPNNRLLRCCRLGPLAPGH